MLHYIRVAFLDKNTDDVLAEKENEDACAEGEGHGDERALFHGVPDPLKLFGTEILGAEGCHGDAEGRHRLQSQLLHPNGCRKPGDGMGTEGIGDGLDQQNADAQNGKLPGHGQAHLQMADGKPGIPAPVAFLQTQNGKMLPHINGAEESGKSLGHDQRVGRTGHAQTKFQNEQQGQPHVDDGGKNQEVHRRFAVA